MMDPDWNGSAKLLRMEGSPLGQVGRGGAVKDGSLAELVREVLAQADDEQWRYSIVRSVGPMLDSVAIKTLSKRPDFPRS